MRVVFNSSPWIFLSKLGFLEKTFELFSEVYIPESVKKEVLARNDIATGAFEKFLKGKKVNVIKAKRVHITKALGRRLGKGEAEAITVAIDGGADMIILDDHAAREEADRLGLQVKGTLGIIRRLMELGMLTIDLHDLYENLIVNGFRVKEDLFWEIFEF